VKEYDDITYGGSEESAEFSRSEDSSGSPSSDIQANKGAPGDIIEVTDDEECRIGWFQRDPRYLNCEDINECTGRPCHHGRATCINKQGDFECECYDAYVGDGFSCFIGLNFLILPPYKHLHSSIPGVENAYKLTLRQVFYFSVLS